MSQNTTLAPADAVTREQIDQWCRQAGIAHLVQAHEGNYEPLSDFAIAARAPLAAALHQARPNLAMWSMDVSFIDAVLPCAAELRNFEIAQKRNLVPPATQQAEPVNLIDAIEAMREAVLRGGDSARLVEGSLAGLRSLLASRQPASARAQALEASNDTDDKAFERAAAAMTTLERLGYEWRGGAEWAPPIGPRPAQFTSEGGKGEGVALQGGSLVQFVAYLADQCKGQVINEEALQGWLADMLDGVDPLDTPAKQTTERILVASAAPAPSASLGMTAATRNINQIDQAKRDAETLGVGYTYRDDSRGPVRIDPSKITVYRPAAPSASSAASLNEPTPEMYEAAQKIRIDIGGGDPPAPLNSSEIRRLWLAMVSASPAAPQPSAKALTDEQRQRVRDAIATALGDAYDCTRVWDAWYVGTMSEADFSMVAEDDERLDEITDAAIGALLAAEQPSEPASSCDPADVCAGCRCKYGACYRAPEQVEQPSEDKRDGGEG